jgi:hypothetical protein
MPKLDVGVGDEFPAKEVREEPPRAEPPPREIHHHYYRRRYRGRWLWFVLWIMAVTLVFRIFDSMMGALGWGWSRTPWGASWGPWGGWGGWGPFSGFQPIEGMLTGILIIGGLIFMTRWRARDEERDADEDRR